MRLRRGRFDELVERQLDLFSTDESALLDEADRRRPPGCARDGTRPRSPTATSSSSSTRSPTGSWTIREAYATTLDEDATEEYRGAFHRAVARRFRRYSSVVADLEP